VLAAGNFGLAASDSQRREHAGERGAGGDPRRKRARGDERARADSNRGKWTDVTAPGYEAATARPTTRASEDGTSDSAAYVSGVVGLKLSCEPKLTPAAVRAAGCR
jgi:subtilisin family serine protease